MTPFTAQKGLSLDRLQTLCLVAEKGGVMAAAAGNPNRQSLFSRQLKELETFFGASLIDRSRTPHSLTELGRQVEQTARGMFMDLEGLAQHGKTSVPVICGAGESVIQAILIPALIGGCAEGMFRLSCRNMRSTAILAGLRNRRLDFGIAHDAGGHADLKSRKLLRYGLRLITRSGKFRATSEVGWSDLKGYSLALPEGDSELRRTVETSMKGCAAPPVVAMECSSHAQVVEAVRDAALLGIVPDFVAQRAAGPGIYSLRIKEMEGHLRELRVLWHPVTAGMKPSVEECVRRLVIKAKNLKAGAGSGNGADE